MDVISLVLFVVLIALAFFRKVNVGVLALGAALILGRILGVADKAVVKYLSQSLFMTLTGVTLLFSAVNSTGSLDILSRKIVSLAGKKRWLLPILIYLSGFVVSAIGPGAVPPTTLVVTLAVTIAFSSGYNPVMMGILGGLGLMGGRVCAYTPEGVLVSTLAAEQGITGSVILPVFIFMLFSTAVYAIVVFFVFKGYKVKSGEALVMEGNHKLSSKQIISLLAIVALLVFVVGLGFDCGLVSYLLCALLFLFNIADESASFKGVPWRVIIMILGVGILMSVVGDAGGIDLLTNILSSFMNKNTAAGFMGCTAGLMSLVSSGLGVVFPTLIPVASNLAASVGGINPIPIICGVVLGGSISGLSSISTCGALILSSYGLVKKGLTLDEQNKVFTQLLLVGIGGVAYSGLMTALFANLITGLVG